MTSKRLCLITLIGGTDIIGDLEYPIDSDTATLWRPCRVQFHPPNNIELLELLRNSPFMTGEHLELHLRAVQWIGQPAKELAAAYMRIKTGVIIPAEAARANQ